MKNHYDAIIIGAGQNGLTAAAYLAKAGRRVLVLERRPTIGGAAATEALWPGFRVDTLAHTLPRLSPLIIRELELSRHGLEFVRSPVSVFAPAPDGGHLALWTQGAKTVEALRRGSPADAERWPTLTARLEKYARFLEAVHAAAPPRLTEAGWLPLLRLGGRLRSLGRKEMVEFLRLLPMSVAEFAADWFETPVLQGALGGIGVRGLFQGPRAIGTMLNFLHQISGEGRGHLPPAGAVRGGIGQVAEALAAAARRRGAEIRTEAEVAQIVVKHGRAVGVALKDGQEIGSRVVASSADPKRTFLKLVDPYTLDTEFVRQVRNLKTRSACAKVNLALAELPEFTCLSQASAEERTALLQGRILIGPDLDYLERGYDQAKYGQVSQRPVLEAAIPTIADPSLAPPGRHILSVFIQYAPNNLKGGWDVRRREALGDLAVETLAEYAPNVRSAWLHRQVLTPPDIEQVYGPTDGNLNHGELMLDQFFFMRPVPGWAQYRTPIDGLYLCGAGAHPGGGGLSGRNAAEEIIRTIVGMITHSDTWIIRKP